MDTRYSRQELFSGIGKEGQKRLQEKHVLVLGAGALGSASAETLVRAGVGTLTIIDRDFVEWSNLHRQQLYTEADAEHNHPKAIAAKNRLQSINKDTTVKAYVLDAKADNLEKLVQGADVVIDGSDNFDIRFIINDLSQKYRVPWIFGAFAGSFGMSYTFLPEKTPCLQCILSTIPSSSMSCETSGIIAPAVQMTSAHQTTEALKILTDQEESLRRTLLLFDVWNTQQQSIRTDKVKKTDCPSCGKERTYPYLVHEQDTRLEVLCGRNTVQIRPPEKKEYDFNALASELKQHGNVRKNSYILICTLSDCRLAIFQDGRVLIHGTKEIDKAKHLYHRFIAKEKE
ncbi:MoeB/ThiF family adenylyltransferase [Alteribacillus bidgolensis]|uniref:Adenylyltransferase and sulfurtransferase n=1 Tax=Alteribacillus bidgolensis TaxID=930129 RepID=A0A1G8HN69_9BACI|nr:MoeB/ThiF family adenylyltransferase [Alteribacillus bidgolensis]SDI07921.1 adenylyltransferase and sulfurtransferase [Alteribacillus bidgolensis]